MFCLKLYLTLFCTTAENVSKAAFFLPPSLYDEVSNLYSIFRYNMRTACGILKAQSPYRRLYCNL